MLAVYIQCAKRTMVFSLSYDRPSKTDDDVDLCGRPEFRQTDSMRGAAPLLTDCDVLSPTTCVLLQCATRAELSQWQRSSAEQPRRCEIATKTDLTDLTGCASV